MRLLHLADLHLGWQPDFLAGKKEKRARERDSILERAVDFALTKNNCIDAVLFAGDLFEVHNPDQQLVNMVITQLQRLESEGIFILTVPGNHDEITYHNSVYRSEAHRWPGVLVSNPMLGEVSRLELGGNIYAFYSLAYTGGLTKTAAPLYEFPRSQADRHIGVLHGSLDWNAGDRSLPISGEGVSKSGYDLLALGHIHGHSNKLYGSTAAVYAGLVEAKDYNDPGCGFFTVLTLNGDVKVEKIPADCRQCLNKVIDLNLCENELEVVQAIRRLEDHSAIMRVVLKGGVHFKINLDKLQTECTPFFYHLRIDSEGMYLDQSLLNKLADEPNIRGYFIKRMMSLLEEAAGDEEREVARRALLRGIAALQDGER